VPTEGDAGTQIAPNASSSSSQPFVLHRQQALSKESGAVIDLVKRQNKQKGKKEDEVARNDNLTPEARTALRGLAHTFIESCFNRAQSSSPPCMHTPCDPYHRIIATMQHSSRPYSRISNRSAQRSQRRIISVCFSSQSGSWNTSSPSGRRRKARVRPNRGLSDSSAKLSSVAGSYGCSSA
jgi:hypothetical protein